jgi:hypothetical protein
VTVARGFGKLAIVSGTVLFGLSFLFLLNSSERLRPTQAPWVPVCIHRLCLDRTDLPFDVVVKVAASIQTSGCLRRLDLSKTTSISWASRLLFMLAEKKTVHVC